MRKKDMLIGLVGVVVGVLLSSVIVVLAGSLDSPGGPDSEAAKMYTLEDIYNRLDTGAAGAQSTFTEPAAGPGSTMHTLNDIMGKAPAEDNTNGAVPGEVLTGKKYWSLRTDGSGGSSWGLETGNVAAGSNVNGLDGDKTFNIPDGFYSGSKTCTAHDAQLVASNIKSGVNIFGVEGTLTPGGDATAADLFDGKTAHLTGDWTPDTGTLDLACNTATFDGTDNLVPDAHDGGGGGNDRWCMTDSGDATPADIAAGKIAWVDGAPVTGNVAAGSNVDGPDGDKTFNIPDGLYSGSKTCTANDAQLVAANIKSGVDIFGVTGSYAGTICTGDATTADVLYPKTFSNSSSTGLTGELYGGCTCTGIITPTGGTRWCDNGDGTVTDLLGSNGKGKCLVWLKKADWGGTKEWRENTVDGYNDAHTRTGILKAADHEWLTDGSVEGDWRLPTKRELHGLTHGTEPVLSSSPRAFTGVQSVSYWSSTTPANTWGWAWVAHLDEGAVFVGNKTDSLYVWPVRGGQ